MTRSIRAPGQTTVNPPYRHPLTVAVWLWSLTASRSYRGFLADGLAVVPGIPRRRPRGRTVGLLADGLAVVLRHSSPADRKAFAALIAPVVKDKTLRGAATFKLIASRGEQGPLVESRVPRKDLQRVAGLLHKGR